MATPLDSITIPNNRTLDLKKATEVDKDGNQRWPHVKALFQKYFPDGLAITVTSKTSDALLGTASIRSTNFPIEAKFSGDGGATNLDLKVTFATLAAGGSGFHVGPSVTFKSENGIPTIDGLDLSAKLRIGDYRVEVGLPGPGLKIEAKLTPNGDLNASTITGAHALGELGTLKIREIVLRADPSQGTYALNVHAKGEWEFVSNCSNCKLKEVFALVLYSSEAKTGWAALTASVELGGVQLVVKAAYDGSVSGWQFEGGTEKPINVRDFIERLTTQLGLEGSGGYPKALEHAMIQEIFVSFNTKTQAFLFRCEIELEVENGKLDIALVIDVQGKKKNFRGTVTLGSLEFDLVIDNTPASTLLVASYSEPVARTVKLGRLIATVSNNDALITAGNSLSFSIKDAFFAYEKPETGDPKYLLAAGFEAGMDFSGLPLIGASFPPGQGARLLFQPLLRSEHLDVGTLTRISTLVPGSGLRLPDAVPEKNISLRTQLVLGAEVIQLGLPVQLSGGTIEGTGGSSVTHVPETATQVDNVTWVPMQKALGPLHLDRVGIGFEQGRLEFLLDAHLTAAGLTLTLQGLGVRVPLNRPTQVTLNDVTLKGIGIDFRSATVEIGGSLLHQRVPVGNETIDEYFGTAILKAGGLTLEAMGSYQTLDNHPSLFLYATLNYPIGGPAFFFVTGLAAAFGYNRSFKLPPIEQLATFPLLAAAPGTMDYRAAFEQLRQYIPADLGAVFLGVGVKFTSFKTVESSALIMASFGKEFALDLIGRSTLVMPAGADRTQAVAFVEMAWLASFRPAQGLLALRAQLSPESYIFSKDCHLTGGFAFYSWFPAGDPRLRGGPDDHNGDFVLTLGGYHPAFDLASHPHYPLVPRLGVAWRVNDQLSIKGDAYYALTSSAVMAGGHLEAVWERHPYKAWFKAGIDCLFEWKPLHYQAHAYVELGASYTFQFFGTQHITAQVGADVTFWGPPFSGLARVNLTLFSFDVTFGIAKAERKPIHLLYDYHDIESEKKDKRTGFKSLLPEPEKICAVSVRGGLVGTDSKKDWIVNPKELCLAVDSAIPSKVIKVENVDPDPGDTTRDPRARFGIAPMDAAPDRVESETTITIQKRGADNEQGQATYLVDWSPKDYFQYRLLTKGVPTALWGERTSKEAKLKGENLINTLAGVEIRTKTSIDMGAGDTWQHTVKLWERHKPALEAGIYSIAVLQTLKVKGERGESESLIATAPLRTFHVGGEQFSLPPSCIHSVFPPEGSLGDHSHVLPQVILERSTLPWERSADAAGADRYTPWLALLVFDQEPETKLESLPNVPGKVKFIEVKKTDLPSTREMKLLAHVRVSPALDRDGHMQDFERAVVAARRKPEARKRSIVHLVSMEKRYEVPPDTVRLVSLWSWSFSCTPAMPSFEGLMRKLKVESFAGRSEPLKHSCADGKRSSANYHGPFAPFLPVTNTVAMPDDVSYRAASELGRLLALQNKSISVGLFRFKRSRSQQARFEAQKNSGAAHLYPASQPFTPARPAEIERWVDGLRKLEGIPFRYLLHNEELLPVESMRFFRLDDEWIFKLLEGALSTGGGDKPLKNPTPRTGILLRSQVVAGWPAMNVEAFGNGGLPLTCLRTARLSRNILMVLYDGTIETISFGLAKEAMHLDLTGKAEGWLNAATNSAQLARSLLKEQDRVVFRAGPRPSVITATP